MAVARLITARELDAAPHAPQTRLLLEAAGCADSCFASGKDPRRETLLTVPRTTTYFMVVLETWPRAFWITNKFLGHVLISKTAPKGCAEAPTSASREENAPPARTGMPTRMMYSTAGDSMAAD